MERDHSLAWWIRRAGGVAVIVLAVLAGAMRYVRLQKAPPGFYADEAIISLEAMSVSQTGRDTFGKRELFTDSGGGGFTSPTHIFPKAVWIKFAGASIYAMRAYAATEGVVLLIGVYFLGRLFLSRRGAWFAVLAAGFSPWLFQFSRMANDDPMGSLCGVFWGLYFFFRSPRLPDAFWAALCFVAAVYSYSSARVVLPALFVLMLLTKRARHPFGWGFVAVMLGAGTALCWPILQGAFDHSLTSRYEMVGMLTPGYMAARGWHSGWEVVDAVLGNVGAHLTTGYLFVHGDRNQRHSTGWVGELSWIDDAALVLALLLLARVLWRRGRVPLEMFPLFCLGGFLIGILPAAITAEGIPHALRSCCCWPFAALLAGYVLQHADARWSATAAVIAAVAAAFAIGFYRNYFLAYPLQCGGAYDEEIKHAAVVGRDRGDWSDFARLAPTLPPRMVRYYLVQYGHLPLMATANVPAAIARLTARRPGT